MNNVENLSQITEVLEAAGYTVEPGQRYLDGLADRLRNAGFTVTAPDTDPAGDRAERDAAARAENDSRQAPAETGITPNGPSEQPPAAGPATGRGGKAAAKASTSTSTSDTASTAR